MDADPLESLGTRFYYAFATAVLLGVLTVAGLAVLAPGEAAFYSLVGPPVVLFLAASAVAVATGQRTGAVGHLVATAGWVVVLATASTGWEPPVLAGLGVADPALLVGLGLTFLGGVVSLAAEHGDRLRARVTRPRSGRKAFESLRRTATRWT